MNPKYERPHVRAIFDRLRSTLALAIAGSAIACGGQEAGGANGNDAAIDAQVDSIVDVATDTSTCPSPTPPEGTVCTTPMTCMVTGACGGSATATMNCRTDPLFAGQMRWVIDQDRSCDPWCPGVAPVGNLACSPANEGERCRYVPTNGACQEFVCTNAKWRASPACNVTSATCTGGVACTRAFGCVVGKCSNHCRCGVDGTLHCEANTC